MSPQDRIKELQTRQVYYDSSMVVKLNAVNGKFFYKVYAWINQQNVDNKSLITEGKYEGQDPIDLIQVALFQMGIKKIKVGNIHKERLTE
jgi:hypothetical protein